MTSGSLPNLSLCPKVKWILVRHSEPLTSSLFFCLVEKRAAPSFCQQMAYPGKPGGAAGQEVGVEIG